MASQSLRPGVDGYTLTGDGNIIHVRVTLKYRLSAERDGPIILLILISPAISCKMFLIMPSIMPPPNTPPIMPFFGIRRVLPSC